MLPPILEIYVVWHPGDEQGRAVAEALLSHFRGTTFSGLIGGAVDVYVRSESASMLPTDAPRAIASPESTPYGLSTAGFTALVVVAGAELASAVEQGGEWRAYVEELAASVVASPTTHSLFPVVVSPFALDKTRLADIVSDKQQVAGGAWDTGDFAATLCRDVAQGITQAVDPEHARLTVFVSHTKRQSAIESGTVDTLIDQVLASIANTRLRDFFDARDLQPGTDWAADLVAAAARGALLAVRSDLYSSRPWCQREIATAKRHGMPVVVLDSLTLSEERGSFLMDHVPRVAAHRPAAAGWSDDAIRSALNLLVDESLKRALWNAQRLLAVDTLPFDIDWWAPHAPEPTTFADWLENIDRQSKQSEPIIVLHPDPPLGPDEAAVLAQMGRLAGLMGPFEFLTPAGLAVRGG
jgi:hypothetical protein